MPQSRTHHIFHVPTGLARAGRTKHENVPTARHKAMVRLYPGHIPHHVLVHTQQLRKHKGARFRFQLDARLRLPLLVLMKLLVLDKTIGNIQGSTEVVTLFHLLVPQERLRPPYQLIAQGPLPWQLAKK